MTYKTLKNAKEDECVDLWIRLVNGKITKDFLFPNYRVQTFALNVAPPAIRS